MRGGARARVRVLVVVRTRVVVVDGGGGGAGGGQLAGGHAILDDLLGAVEGTSGRAAVAEEDEAVALGSAACLVDDDAAVVNVAVAGESGTEALRGSVPAEAVDEELAVGGVEIGDAADLREGGRVGGGSGAEEADELVPRQRLQERPHVIIVVLATVVVVRGRGRSVDDGLVVGLGERIGGVV